MHFAQYNIYQWTYQCARSINIRTISRSLVSICPRDQQKNWIHVFLNIPGLHARLLYCSHIGLHAHVTITKVPFFDPGLKFAIRSKAVHSWLVTWAYNHSHFAWLKHREKFFQCSTVVIEFYTCSRVTQNNSFCNTTQHCIRWQNIACFPFHLFVFISLFLLKYLREWNTISFATIRSK